VRVLQTAGEAGWRSSTWTAASKPDRGLRPVVFTGAVSPTRSRCGLNRPDPGRWGRFRVAFVLTTAQACSRPVPCSRWTPPNAALDGNAVSRVVRGGFVRRGCWGAWGVSPTVSRSGCARQPFRWVAPGSASAGDPRQRGAVCCCGYELIAAAVTVRRTCVLIRERVGCPVPRRLPGVSASAVVAPGRVDPDGGRWSRSAFAFVSAETACGPHSAPAG